MILLLLRADTLGANLFVDYLIKFPSREAVISVMCKCRAGILLADGNARAVRGDDRNFWNVLEDYRNGTLFPPES